MRILLLLILFINLIIAKDIIITLPVENEENISTINIENSDNNKLEIAVLIDKKRFFKYLPSLISSIDAYLLNKNMDFKLKIFNTDANLTNLDEISKNYNDLFIYAINPKIVEKLSQYPENSFFLPIINKKEVNETNVSQSIFFGGLDFNKQINKLSNFVTGKTYIIKENNGVLSDLTTNIEKNLLNYNEIFTYPIRYNWKLKKINNSYLFVNTKVVHTAQILSNFTYYKINPKLILSTQINYNPSIFSLTNRADTQKLIVANSLLLPNIKLLDININLGSDLKFNWLNYTTTALLNKLYVNEEDEYPYFLNDFNLYIFHNQINYKTKLYKIFNNGFIEIK